MDYLDSFLSKYNIHFSILWLCMFLLGLIFCGQISNAYEVHKHWQVLNRSGGTKISTCRLFHVFAWYEFLQLHTGTVISLCDFWFGLKWHSNVLYIWKEDIFITKKTHHLILNISWCQLTLFLSSKLTWSKQAIFHYFSNDFYLKL